MKNKGILILTFFFAVIFMFCGTSTGPDDDNIDPSDSTAPSIPIGLAVDEDASVEDSIKITWEANIDTDFDKYRVYRATGVDSLPLYGLVAETRLTYHRDTGMEYNTDYYYRISAVDKNLNESEKSAAILGTSVNINPPAIPSDFTVYAYNLPGEVPTVEVRWTANTESDLHHYSIYRHTTLQLTPDSSFFISQTT
ncbi:MAG: fibronectin type III domain-containing protein, partial [Candidatus Marinimicrobia bacterium]|nr:fibronectin type III domain-containing protein [Candidatus Neomarinimicrobiota bacterium]